MVWTPCLVRSADPEDDVPDPRVDDRPEDLAGPMGRGASGVQLPGAQSGQPGRLRELDDGATSVDGSEPARGGRPPDRIGRWRLDPLPATGLVDRHEGALAAAAVWGPDRPRRNDPLPAGNQGRADAGCGGTRGARGG